MDEYSLLIIVSRPLNYHWAPPTCHTHPQALTQLSGRTLDCWPRTSQLQYTINTPLQSVSSSHPHSLILTLTLTLSFTLSYSPALSPSHPHPNTNPHSHPLLHTLILTLTHYYSYSLSPSHSHSHTYLYSYSLTHSLTHSPLSSSSLTHTRSSPLGSEYNIQEITNKNTQLRPRLSPTHFLSLNYPASPCSTTFLTR